MELKVTGKNIELTPDLNLYIQQKLSKLNRHLANIIEAKVEIAAEKTRSPQQRFIAQVTVNSSGTLLRAEERGDDLFKAIDGVASVMERQVERYKGKRYNKKGNISVARTGTVLSEIEENVGKVVKVKQFAVRMMTVDEAGEQMELLGHDFFLFLNNDGGKLNLIYRRKD
ncbi:MAG: ribosome-associated translation inhibitor RaiA, partial [Dehalococcoidia bacterium]